jgi:2-hydroxy-3-keto-5-methylthiopentenyl-1-phosphate phosphatase
MCQINFEDPQYLQDLLINAPNDSLLVNTNILKDRISNPNKLVGMDFDGTITTLDNQLSSWQEVRNPKRGILSPQGIQQTIEYYQRWQHDDSLEAQRLWGDGSIQIMHKDHVSKEKLITLGKSLILRNGFLDLASLILSRSTHFAVVTWGLAPIVEATLSSTGIPVTNFTDLSFNDTGILSYAENLEFTPEGLILPPKRKIDHTSVYGVPKINFMNDFKNRIGITDPNFIFVGDSMADVLPQSTNIFVHHRELQTTPNISKLFQQVQYILIGGDLSHLTTLFTDFFKGERIITV